LWAASHVVDAGGTAPVFWFSAAGLAVMTLAFRKRLLSSRRAP